MTNSTQPPRDHPIYPTERMFVVRFNRDSSLDGNHYVGVVEHLESGRARRFSNPEEFFAFVRELFMNPPSEF